MLDLSSIKKPNKEPKLKLYNRKKGLGMTKKAVTPSTLFCHPGSSFVILSEAKDLPGDSSGFPRFAQNASE
jgi:hypothetical protein